MLTLHGATALSEFRITKLLADLTSADLDGIQTTYLHFVDLERDLSDQELDTLHRDAALFGMFGGHVNVTDGRYIYMRAPTSDNSPLYHYTLMPSHLRRPFSTDELKDMTCHEPLSFSKNCPVMRIPSSGPAGKSPERLETRLFDLQNDPDQTQPLDDPLIEQQMIDKLLQAMRENDAPIEQYERLGLNVRGGGSDSS